MDEITIEDYQFNELLMKHYSDECDECSCPICQDEVDY